MKITSENIEKMSETETEQQPNMITGEVMEVMMTGGDIGEMNEETVAQVVNMLQMEGQLNNGNNTIIIRQPGSSEIQMIQTSSNSGELIVTKASEADIQALQANNGVLDTEGQNSQVVMMDEGGNLVEGVVQMQEAGVDGSQVVQLDQAVSGTILNSDKNDLKNVGLLDQLVEMQDVEGSETLLDSQSTRAVTISTTTGSKKNKLPPVLNGGVVSIKINTGLSMKRKEKLKSSPLNVIKISTVTGQQKYQPPKFHKCEACAVNFVSRVAYMNHMENCPSKRKSISIPKGNVTYTCVFCETKFTSRLVLMQHVRTCDKAKSSKNISPSKFKVTTSESKLKVGDDSKTLKRDILEKKKINSSISSVMNKYLYNNKSNMNNDEDFGLSGNLDSDDDKDIPYDDDEDLNEQDLNNDENLEEVLNKRSQKHLGPILVKGMFKCRDCNRTFSKEHQYNRHVKACTNDPLNVAKTDIRLDQDGNLSDNTGDILPLKRKRGRPPLRDFGNNDSRSPMKRKALGPKIVSVNPKHSGLLHEKPKFVKSGFDSDDDDFQTLSSLRKFSSKALSNQSKVVKISPSDTLIKQTSKALMNKMNKEKYAKLFKETPFCGLCGDKFKANNDLVSHTQICHSEDLLNLRDSLDGKGNLSSQKCPLCDLHFVSPDILLLHMVSSHEDDLKTAHESLENQNLHLICPFCFEFSLTQDLFKEHLATKHLDMLINKPSGSTSSSMDIPSLLKDNANTGQSHDDFGQIEKIVCNDCGLSFSRSYLQYHRCAANSRLPRKFLCSETQCSSLSFYKLVHLLTHLQQAHGDTLSCDLSEFDSLTSFMEWLKAEESRTKMKYTKAFQRMKQGKLNTVWICHRFHNAMSDSNMVSKALDPKSRCYSRIHTETSFNGSTSRYDGKTCISYYPEHQHKNPERAVVSLTENTGPIPVSESHSVSEPLGVGVFSASLPLTNAPSGSTAFSDAAELKQLLEGDDDIEVPPVTHPADSSLSPLKSSEEKVLDAGGGDVSMEDASAALIPASAAGVEQTSSGDVEKLDAAAASEEEKDKSARTAKSDTGLVSFSETELLLEKMLDTDSDNATGRVETTKNTSDVTASSCGQSIACCAEPKISDVDMLQAFDSCLNAEETSNKSSVPAAESSVMPPQSDHHHQSETGETLPGSPVNKDLTEESEENTYVLPADLDEWSKLFELVETQLESKLLASPEEEKEAKNLLEFQNNILSTPVERQIQVFNRLCALANVQMT